MRAVETNQLPQLFDRNGYSHFRQEFPRLEAFFNTPPAHRPTVWHLKHFLLCEANTEPPAVLQRDYGFSYCRLREEVSRSSIPPSRKKPTSWIYTLRVSTAGLLNLPCRKAFSSIARTGA
ncbi:hypothetical protein IQ06DRAFT_365740 [Phaeosphaeriaceae sp. SRC1lsM3a]|nr:hypothetical protein IQ06DRAFT_365740 [Stagonospora sp. SRC1lsM3a]